MNGISDAVRRMHALAWKPGAAMARGWWGTLGLSHWEPVYRRAPGCRRAIDHLIVQRRGWPRQPLPAALDAGQQSLLALEARLEKLVSALGLIALGNPEYLILGRYRRALQVCGLGPQDVRQLWPFMPAHAAAAGIEASAETLPALALATGTAYLAAADDPAWHAVRYTLPPTDEIQVRHAPNEAPQARRLLIRLGRFL